VRLGVRLDEEGGVGLDIIPPLCNFTVSPTSNLFTALRSDPSQDEDTLDHWKLRDVFCGVNIPFIYIPFKNEFYFFFSPGSSGTISCPLLISHQSAESVREFTSGGAKRNSAVRRHTLLHILICADAYDIYRPPPPRGGGLVT